MTEVTLVLILKIFDDYCTLIQSGERFYPRVTLCIIVSRRIRVGWLVGFYVQSTARSFRDGTPFTVPCEGRGPRFLQRSNQESNPGPSHGSLLHYHCLPPAPHVFGSVQITSHVMHFNFNL